MDIEKFGIGSILGHGIKLAPLKREMVTEEYLTWLKNTDINQYMEIRFEEISIESVRGFVESIHNSSTALILAIIDANERHIGNIKINWDPNHMVGDLGIMIGDKKSWGKGYGTLAVKLLTEFSINKIGLHKIIGGIYEKNISSKAIFNNAGYIREAILEDHALVNGEYYSIEIWSYFKIRTNKNLINEIDQRRSIKILLEKFKLDASFRSEKINDWNEVFKKKFFQKIKYSNSRIDYEISYLKSFYSVVIDFSVVIFLRNNPIAIFPLIAYGNEGTDRLTGGSSGYIFEPLFIDDLNIGAIETTSKKLYNFITALQDSGFRSLSISQSINFSNNLKEVGSSKFLEACIFGGKKFSLEFDMYLNLTPPYEEIKRAYRKSYFSLINSKKNDFECFIMDHSNFEEDKWIQLMQLHYLTSGRLTRSKNSWDCQFEMIIKDYAFAIYVFSKRDEEVVGFGFFEMTRDECQYSIAAFNRALSQYPLGHLVQDAAIRYMKNRGIKWYYLGESWEIGENSFRSKKEKSISFFKKGFMSNLIPRNIVTLNNSYRVKLD